SSSYWHGLVQDPAGNLFGTSIAGWGVIYRLDPAGNFTHLHDFGGPGVDGSGPTTLVRDPQGNLYGQTRGMTYRDCRAPGPSEDLGSVFQLAPDGTFVTLHAFSGPEGRTPSEAGGLIRDAAGNLYGVTHCGGSANRGVLFQITP